MRFHYCLAGMAALLLAMASVTPAVGMPGLDGPFGHAVEKIAFVNEQIHATDKLEIASIGHRIGDVGD